MARTLPLLFAALLVAAPTSVLCAQDAPKPAPSADEAKKAEDKAKRRAARQRQKGKGGGLGPMQALEGLELTPEVKAQARQAMLEMRDALKKKESELRAMGEVDKKQLRELRRASRKEAAQKMREVLGKEAFKTWREAMNGKGKGRADKRRRAKPKALSSAQLMKTIKLSDEEQAVIKPLLDAVLETQKLLRGEDAQRWAKFRKAALESDDEAKLGELLKALRTQRAEDKATLAKASDKLREVLSVSQEAKLVALRVLD